MKQISLFLLLLLFSCRNNKDKILDETLKQNDYLLHISESKNRDDFEFAKIDKPVGMIRTINEWINLTNKIDSIYNEFYKLKVDSFNITRFDNKYSTEIQKIVLNAILERPLNKFLIDLANKEIPMLFKNDSLYFETVKSSNYNQNTKEKLLVNYVRYQKLQLKEYCYDYCPKIRCGYSDSWAKSIAFIDKPISVKGEYLTISAGIGEFKSTTYPQIFINNKFIDINTENLAELKFKTSKTGQFSIPIKIIEENEDGTKTTIDTKVNYIVVDTICK